MNIIPIMNIIPFVMAWDEPITKYYGKEIRIKPKVKVYMQSIVNSHWNIYNLKDDEVLKRKIFMRV